MAESWKDADTAPLIRLVVVFSLGATVLVTAVALKLVLSRPPGQPETTLTALSTTARDLTAPAELETPRPQPPQPKWIWSSVTPTEDQRAYFRTNVDLPSDITRVTLTLSCDNSATILVSGETIGSATDWQQPVEIDLTPLARGDSIEILIHALNESGPAGLLAVIDFETDEGLAQRVVSDASWDAADSADFTSVQPAVELGDYGVNPWGQLAGFPIIDMDRQLEALPGFDIELVYTVPRDQGSWVSLTADPKGRLIASDQSAGLFRITPPPIGEDASRTLVEPIDSPVGAAQGLLAIDNDLYCMVAGRRAEGEALYRLRDTDGDDIYDEHVMLRKLSNGGEHGPHAIIPGPDGMLYVVAGNHTALPDPEASTVPRHWDEDQLLPRLWDARGHAVGILAPGGWICRTDRDGATWDLFSTGYRNPYDIAFNRDGELFTYDADMEWDMGAPWYRPTRINHVVSGSDYGWRSGTGKWPAYAADSLPATLDIGPGSPTGVCFGYGTNFPPRYEAALFILDWTFGTIYAVHLEADGASYRATREPFVTGRPLPLADAVVNPADGALYFVVGGRGLPSAIYRVQYSGDERMPAPADSSQAQRARRTRHELEALHKPDLPASAIDDLWPHLGSPDRFIAHAARVALEFQPVDRWMGRALSEADARTRLMAMIAMARCADPSAQSRMVTSLEAVDWEHLTVDEHLTLLRCWKLCFIRLGHPDGHTSRRLARHLEQRYPSDDDFINRELCDLLVYLDSPGVVNRTIALMEQADSAAISSDELIDPDLLSRNDTYGSVILKMGAALPQQQQVHYALALSSAMRGWTPDLRERYFRWFEDASHTSGGMSFSGFLDQIRQNALARVPEAERERYANLSATPATVTLGPQPEGPGRAWTLADVLELAAEPMQGRDFENGRRMYEAGMCMSCHRFAGAGEMGGPDLTALSTRFALRDIVEALIEPSRTISDQYQQTEFLLDDDSVVIGRVVAREEEIVRVLPSLLTPSATLDIDTDRIASEQPATVSAMMPNLLNRMNADEVLDLLAYLLSEGDARHPMFTPASSN